MSKLKWEGAVQVLDCRDLASAQLVQLLLIEEALPLVVQLAANDVVVEMLKDAMHAVQYGPLVARLVGQGVRIMRFADVEQPKRWAFL